jgi:hypothetical protein
MKIVFAKEPRVIAHGGQRIALRPGEPWDGDDPLVTEYPDAFVDGPSTVRSTRDASGLVAVGEPPVERATRAPGEKRNVRRPKAGQ